MRAERLETNPILTPESHPCLGDNINGPSLIRVPKWVPDPLGRYYLYFAHHRGDRIRLAYADRVEGPWTVHAPGVLPLAESTCLDHVASPDVHVDDAGQEIRMYFHGPTKGTNPEREGLADVADVFGPQRTKLARSRDGLRFDVSRDILGAPYFRCFEWRGQLYALGMPGVLYRSRDGVADFERGALWFDRNMRHAALWQRSGVLHVFYSNAGDCPERILHSTLALEGDWRGWEPSEPNTLLAPERAWEGADLPLVPSERGLAPEPARQLRDPGVFVDGDDAWLLYAVAGERGLAIARLLPA